MLDRELRYRATFKRETHRRPLIRVSPMASQVSFDIVYSQESFEDNEQFAGLARMGRDSRVMEALVTERVKKAVPRSRYKPGRIERIETP